MIISFVSRRVPVFSSGTLYKSLYYSLSTAEIVKCQQLLYDRLVMVLMESVVSGHQVTKIRERLADKLEFIRFDPYIQEESLYKERKKIRSIKSS